jgi:mannose-6-phosphate isomerase-like protein (cupin superfamily)
MKIILFLSLFFINNFYFAQVHLQLDTLLTKSEEILKVEKIGGDSLTTSFVITIKQGVKKHLHKEHSETIHVLEGEAEMLLGDKMIHIKKGDFIFIPKNTPHKVDVISTIPLKVLSIQAPYFDGKDRLLLE